MHYTFQCMLTLALLAATYHLSAQTVPYHPFHFDDGQWGAGVGTVRYPVGPNAYSTDYHDYTTVGDTVWGGPSYHIVYRDSIPLGGLREDANRRVWYKQFQQNYALTSTAYSCVYHSFELDTTEVLLYDFGLQVGDTIPWRFSDRCAPLPAQDFARLTVVGEDSILLLDRTHRRMLVVQVIDTTGAPHHIYGQYWVEGIGALNESNYPSLTGQQGPLNVLTNNDFLQSGLFHSRMAWGYSVSGFDSDYFIHCYREDTVTYLGYNQSTQCSYATTAAPVYSSPATLSLAPNPFSHRTTLFLDQSYPRLRLDWYDATGRLLRTQSGSGDQLTVERKQLAAGLYFYRVYADERLLGVGKAVVE